MDLETWKTALLVTAAAGIGGTGLGGGLACLFRRDSSQTVSLLLSFAAGVMVAVVCFDLLTDAVAAGEVLQAAMWVLAGYGVTAALNFLLERYRGGQRSSLFLAGVVMAAAIALHNVPEGMVIGASFAGGDTAESGWIMAAVIGLHNIPEGMAVAVPLVAGGMKRLRATGMAAVTGAPTVAGSALGFWMGTLGEQVLTAALSFTSGAMLYVVFGELLPEAVQLWKGKAPALAAVIGIIVGMVITCW